MTGWKTVHGEVTDDFDVDEFDECVHNQTSSDSRYGKREPRTNVHGGSIHSVLMGRDRGPLMTCAKRQKDSFKSLAFGTGNDTGPGSGRVQFYDPDEWNPIGDSRKIPAAEGDLRVEFTR